MKILIAGAGAIGGWLSAFLEHHDVTLLGRPALAQAVQQGGLRIHGLTNYSGQPKVITDPQGRYDMAFLTCKATQTATLGREAVRLARHVVTLQNGLGNAEKLAKIAGPERVSVALTSHGVTAERPGQLLHAGEGMFKVGPCPGAPWTQHTQSVFDMLHLLQPERCEEMRGHIWQKAIVNAGINPVGALHGVTNGGLLGNEREGLMTALIKEATDLAKKARVDLPPGDLVSAALDVCERTATNKCSMLQDVEAKRPTEIEQITGRMVRLGEALLTSMPRNDFVYGRIKDLESSYLGPGKSEETAWQELEHIGLTV